MLLVVTGCAALAIGILVYLADRAASHAVLIPGIPAFSDRKLFGTLGQWLPSLVHPLAFSLFTAALLAPRPRWVFGACGFWFTVNAVFEVGQHPQVRQPLATVLQQSFGQGPVASGFQNYFLRGTFDVGDLLAAALGAAVAAGVLHKLRVPRSPHHAP
jgi:hypothetical protein